MVRSHQDIWPEMTAEERREIMDFKFFPQDRAIYRRQMTKWRKIWDRIYKRLGYSDQTARAGVFHHFPAPAKFLV